MGNKYSVTGVIVVLSVGSAVAEPLLPEVLEALKEQRGALETLYLNYAQTLSFDARVVELEHTLYVEGNRFLIDDSERDVSFDGEAMWLGNKQGPTSATNLILRRTSLSHPYDLTSLNWQLPYLAAAGIHFPQYPSELSEFSGLEPAALYFLENGDLVDAVRKGNELRLTFDAEDPVLINLRKVDLDVYRKRLEDKGMPPASILEEVRKVGMGQRKNPIRNVTLILDAGHRYALVGREDRTENGKLIARYSVGEMKFFEDVRMWLPERCVVAYYTNPYILDKFSEQPVRTVEFRLAVAEFTDREIEFALIKTEKYGTAGTWVLDDRITEPTPSGLETPVIFTVAADGNLVRENTLSVLPSQGMRVFWILLIGAILAVPLVFLLILRVMESKRKSG